MTKPDHSEPCRMQLSMHSKLGWIVSGVLILAGIASFLSPRVLGVEASHFSQAIQPILKEHCYECHAEGANKGKVSFDEFGSEKELLGKRELWVAALKNVRAGLMPPAKKQRPSADEIARLESWIKKDALGLDSNNPDPGRVTLRRLNRNEYRNTIRDLMGFDYKVEEELPPDDTGYGFDNIGDVLTISPLLLEKYMQAAETITAAAVPRVPKMIAEKTITGSTFRKESGNGTGEKLSFYEEAEVSNTFKAVNSGNYRIAIELQVQGQFDFDPGRVRVIFKVGDKQLLTEEFGWQSSKKFKFAFDEKWSSGEQRLSFQIQPLTLVEKKKNSLDLRINSVRVEGPTEKEHSVRPKNFALFFSKDPPESNRERRKYAREVLSRFTQRAFRRPVDERTLEKLVTIAERTYAQKGKRFEDGIAQAMVPVLASPKFLFHVEEVLPATSRSTHPLIDEYSLASRLSYFLWSTMPDEELFRLAGRRELRQNLNAQLTRMLADKRSDAFVENFVGQWLQVRDVEGIDINAFAVLTRDAGEDRNVQRNRQRLDELRARTKLTPEEEKERQELIDQRRKRFGNRPTAELDGDLRRALKRETEMAFAHVVRGDRSILELIDCDYTFLNEKLAKHYGMTNVAGTEMRLVTLPKDHPRGGVLTHGSTLIATSNPTRTSPVKRGLFILDNILGTPTPPPPADVPQLEESEKEFKDHQPTLRETLEIHRRNSLCSSCHNRMDPLGLALENFNAMGMWREKERGQPIDAAGKLVTGESFSDIRQVKRALVTNHRLDFYRCLSEKLLTYALGRGLEYYDVETVDQIVSRLDRESGKFLALLTGIIDSAPFQKRRNPDVVATLSPPSTSQRAEIKGKP